MKGNDKLKESFGSWYKYFLPFIETPEFDKIFKALKEASASGRKIAPLSENVFKAFSKCPSGDLKCIVVGICPYHTFDPKTKLPIADGLCMSCSLTGRLQPSLDNFYSAMEKEFSGGFDPDFIRNPDLSFLAEQGVLLYNVALTVEEERACSMNDIWKAFDRFFWEHIINQYFRGIPCIFLGAEAHKSEKYLQALLHYPFLLPHPASAAYNNSEWDSKGVFRKVNKILQENNNCYIEWSQNKHLLEARKKIEKPKGKRIMTHKEKADIDAYMDKHGKRPPGVEKDLWDVYLESLSDDLPF